MINKTYLTSVDDIFAEDLQDTSFENQVKVESNKLMSAIAVHDERERYGWTQQELAERAGIPQSTVARIENGANTSMETISKIANAFGKNVRLGFV